jgi:hypothetical protein
MMCTGKTSTETIRGKSLSPDTSRLIDSRPRGGVRSVDAEDAEEKEECAEEIRSTLALKKDEMKIATC